MSNQHSDAGITGGTAGKTKSKDRLPSPLVRGALVSTYWAYKAAETIYLAASAVCDIFCSATYILVAFARVVVTNRRRDLQSQRAQAREEFADTLRRELRLLFARGDLSLFETFSGSSS